MNLAESINNKPLNILVADDEEIILYILNRVVKEAGHNVIGFQNGTDTWEYLNKNSQNIDIVVLDKMMYDLDGFKIVQMMKQRNDLKHIPIIIQSGEAFSDKIEDAYALGVDYYLTKPYPNTSLIEAIEKVRPSKALKDQARRVA